MEANIGKDERAVSAVDIFLCYAREDKALLQELEDHLAPLKRRGLITSWDDGDIRVGTEWEQEIRTHLDTAQLVLLLVSPSFMNSDYCYGTEMQEALERQNRGESRVIPVIIRPVYWQGEPLGKLQALPADGKPVTSWSNHDEAFHNVAEGIRTVIGELLCTQWVNIGKSHFKDHEYKQALAAFEKAIGFDPHSVEAYSGKGDALYHLGHYQDALVSYGHVPSVDPSTALKRGQCLIRVRRYEDAQAVYDEMIRLNKKDVLAHAYKGHVLLLLNRYEEALAACAQSLRLDPNSPLAYYFTSSILTHLQRHQQALSAYEQALSLKSDNSFTYLAKGDALSGLGRYEEAFAVYEQAKEYSPNDPWIYERQGDVLLHQAQLNEALSAYEQAIHRDPDSATLYRKKGLVLEQLAQQAYTIAGERGENLAGLVHLEKNFAQLPHPQILPFSLTKLDNLALIRTLEVHPEPIESVAISFNGQYVAATSSTHISIWGLQTRSLNSRRRFYDIISFSSFIIFTLDSSIIITGGLHALNTSARGIFNLWNPYTGDSLGTFEQGMKDGDGDYGICNPDGQTFIGAHTLENEEMTNVRPFRISLWNLHNGVNLLTPTEDFATRSIFSRGYPAHSSRTSSLNYSLDGQTLVSGSSRGDIIIWDAPTMKAIRTITGHKGAIRCLVLSPDGQTLVSGSDDTTIKIWNVRSGKLLSTLEGHTKAVKTLMISSDGQTLLSTGTDNTLYFWDIPNGVTLRVITLPQEKQSGLLSTATVTLDGELLVASIDENRVKIWGNR